MWEAPKAVAPVPPFAIGRVPAIVASVVVACQVGTPFTKARTWPLVPWVVVARRLVPLPKRRVFAWMFAHPVPPLMMPRIPETSEARLMRPVEMAPAVALRTPVKEPTEREPKNAWVDEAYVEEMLVVVALVTVRRLLAVLKVKALEPAKAPDELNWTWVSEPPGLPPVSKQVPLKAKQPFVTLMPWVKVDVAVAVDVRGPESVVVATESVEAEVAPPESVEKVADEPVRVVASTDDPWKVAFEMVTLERVSMR